MSENDRVDEVLGRALDAALARTLRPPQPDETFRRSVRAAIVRAGEADLAPLRIALERENREHLAALDADYIRVRRRMLGALIGAAFAAGAAVTLALPWLESRLGADTPLVLASSGAVLGLAIAVGSWLRGAEAPF